LRPGDWTDGQQRLHNETARIAPQSDPQWPILDREHFLHTYKYINEYLYE